MGQNELNAKYCEFRKYQKSKKEESDKFSSNGDLLALDYLKSSFKCELEANRVAEIYKKSFSNTATGCE